MRMSRGLLRSASQADSGMARPKNTGSKNRPVTTDLEEFGRRMAAHERAASAYQHDVVLRAVGPIGLRRLYGGLVRPYTAAALNAHPVLRASTRCAWRCA